MRRHPLHWITCASIYAYAPDSPNTHVLALVRRQFDFSQVRYVIRLGFRKIGIASKLEWGGGGGGGVKVEVSQFLSNLG